MTLSARKVARNDGRCSAAGSRMCSLSIKHRVRPFKNLVSFYLVAPVTVVLSSDLFQHVYCFQWWHTHTHTHTHTQYWKWFVLLVVLSLRSECCKLKCESVRQQNVCSLDLTSLWRVTSLPSPPSPHPPPLTPLSSSPSPSLSTPYPSVTHFTIKDTSHKLTYRFGFQG